MLAATSMMTVPVVLLRRQLRHFAIEAVVLLAATSMMTVPVVLLRRQLRHFAIQKGKRVRLWRLPGFDFGLLLISSASRAARASSIQFLSGSHSSAGLQSVHARKHNAVAGALI